MENQPGTGGRDEDLRGRDLDPAVPEVPAQVSELNQVWTNLIDNAVDAVGDGGELEVRTEHDGCSVFVRITDDGGGIAEEDRARIFDPFFTTKKVVVGMGLGLSPSFQIVSIAQIFAPVSST